MPSRSLKTWQVDARRALDEIESAHRTVGGTGRGRRYAVQQINQAYVVLLSSWFQAFCRDLHTECVEHLMTTITHPRIRMIVRKRLMEARKLETGNPNAGNLGSDFGRLGIEFWPEILMRDPRAEARQQALVVLNKWRNSIAHQDFSDAVLQGRNQVRLTEVRAWRRVCNALAVDFERAMYHHLINVTGTHPW